MRAHERDAAGSRIYTLLSAPELAMCDLSINYALKNRRSVNNIGNSVTYYKRFRRVGGREVVGEKCLAAEPAMGGMPAKEPGHVHNRLFSLSLAAMKISRRIRIAIHPSWYG